MNEPNAFYRGCPPAHLPNTMHTAAPEITAKVPPFETGGGTSATNGAFEEVKK